MKCNDVNYLYRKNAQGDIAHILDNTGMVVAKYVYDAWGNHVIVDGNGNDLASGVGVLNPFRYRGYYYDTETNLYYLQTRYYDPEAGRFLSQDDVSYLAPDNINGLNLYAYCANNPVMNVDPTGCDWDWLGWVFTGLILVGLTAATVFTFGVAAPITGIAATMVVGATVGAYTGFGFSIATQLITTGSVSPWSVFVDTASGALFGALSGGMGANPALSTRILVGVGKIALNVATTISHGLIDGKSQQGILSDAGMTLATSVFVQGVFVGLSMRQSGYMKQLIEHLLGQKFMEQIFPYVNSLKITFIQMGAAMWDIISSLWE